MSDYLAVNRANWDERAAARRLGRLRAGQLLGLRLSSRRSPDTVAGWRIGARGDGWIRLEVESGFLSCNLLVQATGEWVSLATFLRYDRPVGHLVWPPLSAIHRGLVPRALRGVAARIRASRRGNG